MWFLNFVPLHFWMWARGITAVQFLFSKCAFGLHGMKRWTLPPSSGQHSHCPPWPPGAGLVHSAVTRDYPVRLSN